ncbi:hypothetical protein LH464_14690 [Neorhizobium sp. T786]|uniref:hypothetical protein n=1 Tax=Pseudorhizobium xiangyangii TaxID=2883104 RepID=UPI001CFF7174|nr:hypothetical protein [Neorhizobium xiangyangii]MCB5203724.1 hypothetical protein [Neorhizobium xiangyangii]
MRYLIEILLPVGNDAQPVLTDVRAKLTETFGGVTMHINAPAEGLWVNGGDIDRDTIVVVEVMTEDLDPAWWASYRKDLEDRLDQEEIVIRASEIQRL